MKKKNFTFVSAVALLMVSCGPINTDTPPVGNEDKEEQEEGVEEEGEEGVEEEEQQPDNVILYTTVDGTKLFPTTTEPQVFGAFLVSNTYEDGQGVLTFDDAITSIGESAFQSCTSLTSITIPDSVTSIGERAFYGCSSLKSVTIPDSVTSIGRWAFSYCSKLANITVHDSVVETSNDVLENSSENIIIHVKISDLAKFCTSNVIYQWNKHAAKTILYVDNN